jgi:uncharacterized membrane protein YhaH (DUF805 family)
MRWMIMPYTRYADFRGRSCRMEYWMFHLLWAAVLIVLWTVGVSAHRLGNPAITGTIAPMCLVLGALFLLGSLIPMIAVTVRRFHDQDKTGWFYLMNFIPYVGGLVVFIFMCIEGTVGSNQYGPDPKGPEINANVFN